MKHKNVFQVSRFMFQEITMDHHIDAKNKILGRLASEIAVILQDKLHSSFEPRLEGKDRVFVNNISKIKFSGKKLDQKIYYRFSGYVGHLKQEKLKEKFKKNPDWVLRRAVYQMLPKNKLRAKRIKRLIIND